MSEQFQDFFETKQEKAEELLDFTLAFLPKDSEQYRNLFQESQELQNLLEKQKGNEINIAQKDLLDLKQETSDVFQTLKTMIDSEVIEFHNLNNTQKEILFSNSEVILQSITNKDFIISFLGEIEDQYLVSEYQAIHSSLKMDKDILQLVLRTEHPGYGLFSNSVPKDFFQDPENIVFFIENYNQKNEDYGLNCLSLLSKIDFEEDIELIIKQLSKSSDINQLQILNILPDHIFQNTSLLSKYFNHEIIMMAGKARKIEQEKLYNHIINLSQKPIDDITYDDLDLVNIYISRSGTDKIENLIIKLIRNDDFSYLFPLHNNKKFLIEAIKVDAYNITFASHNLQNDPDILILLKNDIDIIQHLNLDKESEDIIETSIEKKSDETKIIILENNSTLIPQYNGNYQLKTPTLKTPIEISEIEQEIINNAPKGSQEKIINNIINFHDYFTNKVKLPAVWEYRDDIIDMIGGSSNISRSDSIDESELVKIGNFVLQLIYGKEQKKLGEKNKITPLLLEYNHFNENQAQTYGLESWGKLKNDLHSLGIIHDSHGFQKDKAKALIEKGGIENNLLKNK